MGMVAVLASLEPAAPPSSDLARGTPSGTIALRMRDPGSSPPTDRRQAIDAGAVEELADGELAIWLPLAAPSGSCSLLLPVRRSSSVGSWCQGGAMAARKEIQPVPKRVPPPVSDDSAAMAAWLHPAAICSPMDSSMLPAGGKASLSWCQPVAASEPVWLRAPGTGSSWAKRHHSPHYSSSISPKTPPSVTSAPPAAPLDPNPSDSGGTSAALAPRPVGPTDPASGVQAPLSEE